MGRLRIPDVGLLSGEDVEVFKPSYSHNEAGDESVSWPESGIVVGDVLVSPADASSVEDSNRPHGTRAAMRLAFPKGFGSSLRGCRVKVRGRTFEVVGDPRPNQAQNCPTRWWYTAEVEAVDG